ncbi:hypothetical protein [Arthrobacter sp.]|uniref:hypothetical protein n=1 Tax=Arthrobacter sp. TaxID=1667 RepID=UPI0035C76D0A
MRVWMVEYTPGYLADHWCVKGHVLLCTAGRAPHRTGGRPHVRARGWHELSGSRRRQAPPLRPPQPAPPSSLSTE